jgi:hypothetical protein
LCVTPKSTYNTIMETLPNANIPAITNSADTTQKVERLLKLDKITIKDFERLTKPEQNYFAQNCTTKLGQLKGTERDNFLAKIEPVITPTTKSDIWDYNHSVISSAIAGLMRRGGTMPGIKDVAEKTGLSRQTVAKHLKEYQRNPEFTAGMEQFKFMAPNVLTSVLKNALNGDTRAARLYLEMVGAVNKQSTSTVINEQNNYIQVNSTILSQENLNRLTADQLNQIESIVTNRR